MKSNEPFFKPMTKEEIDKIIEESWGEELDELDIDLSYEDDDDGSDDWCKTGW